MYQNTICNNNFVYYTQYQLPIAYYPRGVVNSILQSQGYPILNQGNLFDHNLYHNNQTINSHEEYFRSMLNTYNQETNNRSLYHQMMQAPFLQLNSCNIPEAKIQDSMSIRMETGNGNGNCENDNGLTDLSKESNLFIKTISMPIDQINLNKQLISHKKHRDKPNKQKPPQELKEPKRVKGKKTQKDRANELLEDSFLHFLDKKRKTTEEELNQFNLKNENEEKEDYNDAFNEIEEDSNNIGDTDTDLTTTKIIFHSNSYKPTANSTDFMKYNFNFELNAQYKTEKLIINFEDQHAVLNKEDFFGLMNVNVNGPNYNNTISHYNRSINKIPKKVWSNEEYNKASSNNNTQITDFIKEIQAKDSKKSRKYNEENILSILKINNYNMATTNDYLSSNQ